MSGRFVVLGLARTRRPWLADLARWSTSGSLPVEFLTCMSVDEVLAVVGSGRRVSAVVVDAAVPRFDRELIRSLGRSGAVSLVVVDGRIERDWDAIGCVAVLQPDFGQDELLEQLQQHARPVERDVRQPGRSVISTSAPRTSTLLAVMGAGGVGTSTVAMATAQAMSGRDDSRSVALVDGARHSDLAMYHDVGDVIPGLPELVEAHRSDSVDPVEIRRLLFRIDDRGYDVLLGLRRPRDWVGLRSAAVDAALGGLGRSYDTVVVDADRDLEGEAETGSLDLEDRHSVSRAVAGTADLILAVGRPGVKGINDLVHLVDDLIEAGCPAPRVIPVVNCAQRNPAARAAMTSSVAQLVRDASREAPPVLHLPATRSIEHAHRQVAPMPESLCRPIRRLVDRLLGELGHRDAPGASVPERITPGALGTAAELPVRRSDVA